MKQAFGANLIITDLALAPPQNAIQNVRAVAFRFQIAMSDLGWSIWMRKASAAARR